MDSEFDNLAHLWRGDAEEQDVGSFSELSKRAVRRAQWAERAEFAVVGALTLLILFGVWRQESLRSLLIGSTIIALLLWSSRTRYRLRRIEWSTDASDHESFLRSTIRRTRARARRTFWSLVLLVPATLLGMLFPSMAGNGAGSTGRPTFQIASWSSLAALLSLAATFAYLVVRMQRQRNEHAQLTRVLNDYRREASG